MAVKGPGIDGYGAQIHLIVSGINSHLALGKTLYGLDCIYAVLILVEVYLAAVDLSAGLILDDGGLKALDLSYLLCKLLELCL